MYVPKDFPVSWTLKLNLYAQNMKSDLPNIRNNCLRLGFRYSGMELVLALGISRCLWSHNNQRFHRLWESKVT